MTKVKKVKFDRDEVYNDWIQNHDDLSHDEISDYIEKIKFLYEESNDKDFKFFQNQDPMEIDDMWSNYCLLYTSPSPRDRQKSRMPSSA